MSDAEMFKNASNMMGSSRPESQDNISQQQLNQIKNQVGPIKNLNALDCFKSDNAITSTKVGDRTTLRNNPLSRGPDPMISSRTNSIGSEERRW